MDGKTFKPDLAITEQKTSSLSFCEATPKALQAWTAKLPVANIGETSRLLYHGIIELNQMIMAPQQRLALLEILRPRIRFVCTELARHYLGLAVDLPEKQRKIANLSMALHQHLTNGYKACILDFVDQGNVAKTGHSVALSAHRAVTELGQVILRCHQLYRPIASKQWLECHSIFSFILRRNLDHLVVEDETLKHSGRSTVSECYKRILLLGCSRPNQLRQNELAQIYELFEVWAQKSTCSHDLSEAALFVVNPLGDSAPQYRSLTEADDVTEDWLGFDTKGIASALEDYLDGHLSGNAELIRTPLALPVSISDTLLEHLRQALGNLSKRSFNRISSKGHLDVCVGLTNTHYFVANETVFSSFVSSNLAQSADSEEAESNMFLRSDRNADPWQNSFDAGSSEHHVSDAPIQFRGTGGVAPSSGSETKRSIAYRTQLINTSPGGYCIRWDTEMPANLQTGELVGVREQSTHPWSLAVVRWIRQVRGNGTQLGIELVAPSAYPCGVRLIHKVGKSSEYLRALLLPEIPAVNQKATLITPRLPFKTGSRISMLHDGQESQGVLGEQLVTTGSISQFALKVSGRMTPLDTDSGGSKETNGKKGSSTSGDEFDSLWPSL